MDLKGDELITVCDKCFRACCWQGEFMCEDSGWARTTEKTVQWLRDNPHGEHEHYWQRSVAVNLQAEAAESIKLRN